MCFSVAGLCVCLVEVVKESKQLVQDHELTCSGLARLLSLRDLVALLPELETNQW